MSGFIIFIDYHLYSLHSDIVSKREKKKEERKGRGEEERKMGKGNGNEMKVIKKRLFHSTGIDPPQLPFRRVV
jgi:hypothetical protein